MGKFIKVPEEVLFDPELTDPERRVLLALYSFADNDTGKCYPGAEKLMAKAKVKLESYLSRITGSLVKKGWLAKKRLGYSGKQTYRVSVPSRLANSDLFHEEPVLHGECKNDLHGECKKGEGENTSECKNNLHGECKNILHGECKNRELTNELTKELTKDHRQERELPRSNIFTLSPRDKKYTIDDVGWCFGDDAFDVLCRVRPDLVNHGDEIASSFVLYFRETGEQKTTQGWQARWERWLVTEKRKGGEHVAT